MYNNSYYTTVKPVKLVTYHNWPHFYEPKKKLSSFIHIYLYLTYPFLHLMLRFCTYCDITPESWNCAVTEARGRHPSLGNNSVMHSHGNEYANNRNWWRWCFIFGLTWSYIIKIWSWVWQGPKRTHKIGIILISRKSGKGFHWLQYNKCLAPKSIDF
jgi:hypothetical protein